MPTFIWATDCYIGQTAVGDLLINTDHIVKLSIKGYPVLTLSDGKDVTVNGMTDRELIDMLEDKT